ncbi:Aste57867_9374 [Aphanomyces stellatus]|uniref:Aste57867_9374 protein n=1 Tax=Aphanomyces stellatus TaxID=120398 RepID=A0A485KMM5_9STRA|nr:hypothetical protein As57867_009338 [Aphanomyces stellatus]VFT86255.1 Aste57867_9374 [Aphanomyces stellatus]
MTTMTTIYCHFNGCKNIAIGDSRKCEAHKRKGMCAVDSCHNQAYRCGLCVRHGARSSQCSVDGCTKNVRVNGVCYQHAAILPSSQCAHEGCKSMARGSATCKRHSPRDSHVKSAAKNTIDEASLTPLPIANEFAAWDQIKLEGLDDVFEVMAEIDLAEQFELNAVCEMDLLWLGSISWEGIGTIQVC